MTDDLGRDANRYFWVALVLPCFLAGPGHRLPADEQALPVADLKRDTAVDFEDEIMPLLKQNCLACHNASEAENDLVLESPQTMLAGGIEGPALVAGQAGESFLWKVSAHLTEPFMPPEDNDVGAKNLTATQLGLLKLWIHQGAHGQPVRAPAPIQWQALPMDVHPVYCVAISPHGSHVAATRSNQISVYHLKSKKEVARLTDPAVVSIGIRGQSQVAHLDLVQSLAFSPDGLWLASGGFRTVKLWQRTWPIQTLKTDLGAIQASTIARSRDGSRVAVGTTDGHIVIVDGLSAQVLKTLGGQKHTIRSLAFSRDGSRLVSGSDNKTICLWDVVSGRELGSTATPDVPLAVAWVADAAQIATGGANRVIQLWPVPASADTGNHVEPVAQLTGHDAPVIALASISGTEQLVSGSQDGTIRIWNLQNGRVLHRMDHGAPVVGTVVGGDGLRIASIGENRVAKLWDAATGQLKAEFRGNLSQRRRAAQSQRAVELAKQHVTNAKSDLDAGNKHKADEENHARQAAKALPEAEEVFRQKTAAAEKAASQKHDAEQALVDAQNELRQRQAQSRTADEKLQEANDDNRAALPHAKQTADIALKQAKERVKQAEGTLKQRVQSFDKASADTSDAERKVEAARRLIERNRQATQKAGQAIPILEASLRQAEKQLQTRQQDAQRQQQAANEAGARLRSIAFSVDGTELAISSENGAIHTFDGDDGSPEDVFAIETDPIAELAYLADGRLLLASSGRMLTVCSTQPRWQLGRTIGSPNAPTELIGRVTALEFSPDGKQLATGGGEVSRRGELKLWNVADGRLVREIEEAHDDTVLGVAFSPDGKQLASCGSDRLMKVFDVDRGHLVRVFEGHTHYVLGVSWQADSRRLATCGADRVIKIWDVRTGDQQRTITGFTKEITAIRFLGLEPRVVVSVGNKLVTSRKADGGRGPDFSGVSAFMYTVTCSADGQTVVAGGHDGVVRVWNNQGKPIVTFMPPPSTALGQSATN